MSMKLLDATNWSGKALSGEWKALDGGHLDVIEPATGQPIGGVSKATPADIRIACGAALQAQPGWAVLPYAERAKVFRRAAELLEANRTEFVTWLVRETGGIAPKAMFEIDSVLHLCHEAAAMLTQPTGLVLPSASGVTSLARRRAARRGRCRSPFNFPFLLSSRAVLPALAAGNAVVPKPDPRTPVSGGVMLALLLQAAGLPKGAFHMCRAARMPAKRWSPIPPSTMVSFTGSTAVGRRVGELAGRHLKKVALELGGKNALIVLDDADLDLAIVGGAWASSLTRARSA